MGCSSSVASKSIASPVALALPVHEEQPTDRPPAKKDASPMQKSPQNKNNSKHEHGAFFQKAGEADNFKNQSMEQNISMCNQTSKIVLASKKERLSTLGSSNKMVPDSMK